MRTLLKVLSAVMICTAVLTAPAAATDQSTAIKLCEKAPNCTVTKVPGHATTIEGTNSRGSYVIGCPAQGACSCITCPRTQPGSKGPRDLVATVLGVGSKAATSRPATSSARPGSILDNSGGYAAQNPSAVGSPITPPKPVAPPPPQIR
jgi:hypothetical protein